MQIAVAIALLAAAQNYEGTITKFDAKSNKIHMVLSDRSTGNWTLSPKARVLDSQRKPMPKTALRAGEHAMVVVEDSGAVDTVLMVPSDWGKTTVNARMFSGRVVAIHKKQPFTFEVESYKGGHKQMFEAPPNTRFLHPIPTGPAEPGSMDDVRDGATVTVLVDNRTHKVYAVDVYK